MARENPTSLPSERLEKELLFPGAAEGGLEWEGFEEKRQGLVWDVWDQPFPGIGWLQDCGPGGVLTELSIICRKLGMINVRKRIP